MNGPKTITGERAPQGRRAPDAAGPYSRRGEFERLLAERESKRLAEKARPQGRVWSDPGTQPRVRGRAPEGVVGRADGGGLGHGPTGTRGLPAREAAAREAFEEVSAGWESRASQPESRHLPPGSHAFPTEIRWEPEMPAATEPGRTADIAAFVERIANEIVRLSEVRHHADGAVEARLELDLGPLGRICVSVERTAEGGIRALLELTSPEARRLINEHLPELATRLEARGLNLRELKVESTGETALSAPGSTAEAGTTVTPPSAALRECAPRGDASRSPGSFDDERERRGREPEPPAEEEHQR